MSTIDNTLAKLVQDGKTPSVHYTFFNQDRILHTFKAGFVDVQHQQAVSDDTLYNAYSATKTFTALSILQLAEQGKIDLDQAASNYLPDFPYPKGITVRQLMTHSAGIVNPIPLSWIHLETEHSSFDGNNFFRQIMRKHPKVKSKPNEKFAYTNLGYILLGSLIERVSGMPYEDYVRENILRRLNLKREEIDFTVADSTRRAKGYHQKNSFSYLLLGLFLDVKKYMDKTEGKWKPFKPFYINGAAYGGLVGTPNAFVQYVQALLKPDSVLISDAYKKMLFTENQLNKHQPSGMALSWFCDHLNGTKYCAHAGGGGGYYCEIRIYPEKGLGSVVMFNRTGMTNEKYLDKLDQYFIS